MQIVSTISKGMQITIPSALRQKLNIKPADQIVFDLDTTPVTVKKAQTLDEQIDEMIAAFDAINAEDEKHLTPEQRELNKKTAGWTVNQYHEYFDNLPETKAYIKEKYGL